MHVDREDFERGLREAVGLADADPRHGLYGPGTASWRIGRESILFLGGGAAALLQLAHPYVAHAVDQHSATRSDPLGRFQRTFMHVNAILFGDLETALGSARRVRHIHDHILGHITEDVGEYAKGHRYEANDDHALLWVHATLIHTAVQVYELCVRRLRDEEREAYWEESKRFAMLFGVPASILPARWADFLAYWDRQVTRHVRVGQPAHEMGTFLLTPPPTRVPLGASPAGGLLYWYERVTAFLLPPALRSAFGLTFTQADQLLVRSSLRALRAVYPRMPRRVRDVPAYVEAQRRLAGKTGPDRFGRALERVVLRTVTGSP